MIKFGGGLITEKSQLCTPNLSVIENLVNVVSRCLESGLQVIVVHGAGSFGHLRAKHWRLSEGQVDDYAFSTQEDCESQKQAVSIVRKEMLTLNKIVCEEFAKQDISTKSMPPHQWAKNTGSSFEGEITENFSTELDVIVTFGDVVDCDEKEFGILSGDDIVVRICQDIANVSRLVFAIKGVDGILMKPPEEATDEDLVTEWSPSISFRGVHNTEIDVTGGIALKAKRGAEVASLGVDVFIVNGEKPERVFDACMGIPTRGTRIYHE